VLFSDVVGSTAMAEALDPETVRAVMARYFARMRTIIEYHGGTVEKFIGDAIMAVFGLPVLHEDDPLRAVKAALGMRESLVALNRELRAEPGIAIEARTGINTGEVVAGDSSGSEVLVTGDAVNTAARLEQAAGVGEILMGESTWQLVRHRVAGEALAAVRAKGKSLPVAAFRLLSLTDAPAKSTRPTTVALFGREAELAEMRRVFGRVRSERTPALLTVLGAAGVGKSRLVAEFAASVSNAAMLLRGRCLPYGEGITYWPVREVLLTAAAIGEGDSGEAAIEKLRASLTGARDGALLARRLASAIGLSAEAASREEIFWAVRRTLEHLADAAPLVVVVEDIHWAQSTLVELLEHVAGAARNARLLIVCPARPELLDAFPGWAATAPSATTIFLEGLVPGAVAGLVESLRGVHPIDADLRTRIIERAEGNPLFLEEMVRMVVEDGARAAEVPPTIQALLAARLDGLPLAERAVARRASVVGRLFDTAAVAALSPADPRDELAGHLLSLVRRDLVRPVRSELTEEEAFKFRHILVRDAAYAGLPKSERSELHERFADWLERVTGNRAIEYQEILGYHLRQAHGYRIDLREGMARAETIGRRAARHLRTAARRARDRGDSSAAVELSRQAQALPLPDRVFEAELKLESALALLEIGRVPEARVDADAALRLATELEDLRLAARARLSRLDTLLADGTLVDADPTAREEARTALDDAEASGDPLAQAVAWQMVGGQAYMDGRFAESIEQTHRALGYAQASGDVRYALELEVSLLTEAVVGTMPAAQVVELGRSMLDRMAAYPSMRADVLRLLAVPEAMIGRCDSALAHAEQSVALFGELGQVAAVANARADRSWVHRLCGHPAAAEAELRQALADLEPLGDRTGRSFVSCRLAMVLLEQGRVDEAGPYVDEAETVPIVMNRTRVVGARARLHALAGDPRAADEVSKLTEMLASVPFPNILVDGFVDAAEAMASLGDRAAALRYAAEAQRIALDKGNAARAAQVQAIVNRIGTAPGRRTTRSVG
jgi:class 3 adenylate cyclase/tetratricopeptide (TPR) repeat protein